MEGSKPPAGLPPSPRKAREDALTRLFNSLSTLAELGADVARELLEQAEQEKVENAERRARTMQ